MTLRGAAAVAALVVTVTGGAAQGAGDRPHPARQIAFVSSPDPQNHDIAVMSASGGQQRNLTADTGPTDLDPAYSPEGTKIAFRSTRAGAPDIYVMDSDGSNPVSLTAAVPGDENSAPSFSPDGRRIVFNGSRFGASDGGDIYVMRADGSHLRNLTPGGDDFGSNPTFSPDGKLIAFERSTAMFGNDVWLMRADGSKPRDLTGTVRNGYVPSFSPDGRRIAFSSTSIHGDFDILVMTRRGRVLENLTPRSRAHDLEPAYSPNGERIVFARGTTGDIFVMRDDGSKVRNLTKTPSVGEYSPVWRP